MISPYSIVQEAREKMSKMILDFPRAKEEKVLMLINSADTYPNMSAYQIEQARIMLIDLYISHEIYGNAYDLCRLVADNNPKAPVKKKLRELNRIKTSSPDSFIYSCDLNIVDKNLCYADMPDKDTGKNDMIYDEEFELLIEDRLSKLDGANFTGLERTAKMTMFCLVRKLIC